MVLRLTPDIEAVLNKQAKAQGISPEDLALRVLRERLPVPPPPIEPRDDWERRLLEAATDCGVSLSNEALSREELYD